MEPTARRATAVVSEPASVCLPHLSWRNRAISLSDGGDILPPAADWARQRHSACLFGLLGRLLGRSTAVATPLRLVLASPPTGQPPPLCGYTIIILLPLRNTLSFVSLTQDEVSGGLIPALSAH
jgi:hypothetical protein